MTALWVPPAPDHHVRAYSAGRPARPLWSARRTVLAVLAALAIGAVTTVGVSFADTGSSGTSTPRGGFGGPGLGPGFGRGGFGQNGFGQGFGGRGGFGQNGFGQGFGGRGGFGQNGFSQNGAGQNGFGQNGPAQPNVQPAPTAST